MLLGWLQRALLVALLILFVADSASAQAAAEYAGALSIGAAVTQAQTEKKIVFPPSPQEKSQSSHLRAQTLRAQTTNKPLEATNRQVLEDHAGKDPGKLLLRSVPTGAQVWIDGKRIGSTPLLLILASGKYKVKMEGSRKAFAQKQVDLLPRERQEVVLNLEQRYPSHMRLR